MVTIRVKKVSVESFEAWEVQECNCGQDKYVDTFTTMESLKIKISELYKSGLPTPTRIKYIENE